MKSSIEAVIVCVRTVRVPTFHPRKKNSKNKVILHGKLFLKNTKSDSIKPYICNTVQNRMGCFNKQFSYNSLTDTKMLFWTLIYHLTWVCALNLWVTFSLPWYFNMILEKSYWVFNAWIFLYRHGFTDGPRQYQNLLMCIFTKFLSPPPNKNMTVSWA